VVTSWPLENPALRLLLTRAIEAKVRGLRMQINIGGGAAFLVFLIDIPFC
jgi:hypothetical protein